MPQAKRIFCDRRPWQGPRSTKDPYRIETVHSGGSSLSLLLFLGGVRSHGGRSALFPRRKNPPTIPFLAHRMCGAGFTSGDGCARVYPCLRPARKLAASQGTRGSRVPHDRRRDHGQRTPRRRSGPRDLTSGSPPPPSATRSLSMRAVAVGRTSLCSDPPLVRLGARTWRTFTPPNGMTRPEASSGPRGISPKRRSPETPRRPSAPRRPRWTSILHRLRACTFSHRNHSVDRAASIAAGGQASGDVIGFLKTARARVAVIENVCEPDGVATIDTILTRESTAYKWSSQCISVKEHAGVPMGRIRHFWLGLRKPGVVPTVA